MNFSDTPDEDTVLEDMRKRIVDLENKSRNVPSPLMRADFLERLAVMKLKLDALAITIGGG